MVFNEEKHIVLTFLIELPIEKQLQILEIRNQESVRKWMYTDHIIQVDEHLAWIGRLKSDNSQMVFAILDCEGAPIGLASISKINTLHKTADWAFYLSEDCAGKGIGSTIEFAIIEFAFGHLQLEKLNCEVIDGNAGVLHLHRKFLFDDEGFRNANIIKNGVRVGVHFMGLQAVIWRSRAVNYELRYNYTFEFPERNPVDALIDKIQETRSRNNLNWMNLLRIAMEKSPKITKEIVADIHKADAQINKLSKRLSI